MGFILRQMVTALFITWAVSRGLRHVPPFNAQPGLKKAFSAAATTLLIVLAVGGLVGVGQPGGLPEGLMRTFAFYLPAVVFWVLVDWVRAARNAEKA